MTVLLLGEPDTGKTSFLVAFYGALVDGSAAPFELVNTLDDVEFLSRGLEALARQERVKRTDSDDEARMSLEVRHGDKMVAIEVPDHSGELLKAMINDRVWDPTLRRDLDSADGAILFIRADQFTPGETADDVAALLGELVEDEPSREDSDPVPWRASLMPTDVRTIDTLQAISSHLDRPLPVALVISAWDLVHDITETPHQWLTRNLPLLAQYLESNSDSFPSESFGVSAQGGSFRRGLTSDLAEADPWDRAFAASPTGERTSLSRPVEWLLERSQ